MNNIDLNYQNLLKDILENGVKKTDRTGTGTISVFGRQIKHKMSEGFPLLTTKKMAWKTMVTELLWFLRGDTNIKFLVDNGCHIWNGDAYKRFQKTYQFEKDANHILPDEWMSMSDDFMSSDILSEEEFINKIKTDDEFAKKWGDLGKIYGFQWRNWGGRIDTVISDKRDERGYLQFDKKATRGIDQIQNLINELKTNPDSRRLLVTAWNPSDLPEQVLPPCHYGFQVYTRELSDEIRYNIWFNNNYETGMERYFNPNNLPDFDNPYYKQTPKRAISLMWGQRSCDFPLGIPANIMSYALLLMMIAKQVNMVPDELIGNFGDCHVYLNQINGVKEQLTREPYPLPNVILSEKIVNDISEYTLGDIVLENYQSRPKIYFPLSN
jgi:thymidylate synthase